MAPLAMDLVRVEVGRRDSECIPKVSTIAEQSQEGDASLLASSLKSERSSGFRKMLKAISASCLSSA